MKTKIFALLICSSVIAACSSNRNTPEAIDNTPPPRVSADAELTVNRDGSSFEKAIIIKENTESAGVQAQNAQLSTLHPGYKRVSQHFELYKEKQHELVNVTIPDGREIVVYFDISNYFGKP